MRRREFLRLLAGVTPFSVAPANAQQAQKTTTVGYLAPRRNDRLLNSFLSGMRDLGYDQGRNFTFTYQSAEGRPELLEPLARELITRSCDVIVTLGATAARIAARLTSTIPIVFVPAGDAVAIGLVQSLARPGGNVTGLSLNTWILNSKRLEVLKESFPSIKRVGVIANANSPSGLAQWQRLSKSAGVALNLELVLVVANGPKDLSAAFFKIMQEGADGLTLLADAEFDAARQEVVTLANQTRLPAIFEHRAFVEAGGLMSYGPNLDQVSRRGAIYVDKIIKGQRPDELPVEEPTVFEFLVNLRAAASLGLNIPPLLLARADEVIE